MKNIYEVQLARIKEGEGLSPCGKLYYDNYNGIGGLILVIRTINPRVVKELVTGEKFRVIRWVNSTYDCCNKYYIDWHKNPVGVKPSSYLYRTAFSDKYKSSLTSSEEGLKRIDDYLQSHEDIEVFREELVEYKEKADEIANYRITTFRNETKEERQNFKNEQMKMKQKILSLKKED